MIIATTHQGSCQLTSFNAKLKREFKYFSSTECLGRRQSTYFHNNNLSGLSKFLHMVDFMSFLNLAIMIKKRSSHNWDDWDCNILFYFIFWKKWMVNYLQRDWPPSSNRLTPSPPWNETAEDRFLWFFALLLLYKRLQFTFEISCLDSERQKKKKSP